jgi:DNA mismatch repair protein MSH2
VLCDTAAVIAFSELMAMDSGHHKWDLSLHNTGRYMRLDAAAQRALNVMKQRTDANDTFSLYGLMNKGRTPMAKRLLKVSLCLPALWMLWPAWLQLCCC